MANLKGELETGAENGSRLAPGEQVDLGAERALDTVELADRNVLELKYIFLKQTKKSKLTETWAMSVIPDRSDLMWKSAPLARVFLAATAKLEWSEPIIQPYLSANWCESPD